MDPIQLRYLRSLSVSAASGLLFINEKFYVIADDELSLSIFSKEATSSSEQSIPIFAGELSEEPKERKKSKPDFEALVHLSQLDSILVLPSGSKENRVLGALIKDNQSQVINFENLYRELLLKNPDLNIEGAVIANDKFKLFSRGNGPSQKNFLINLNLNIALSELKTNQALSASSFEDMKECDLGKIHGENLSFTDAATENSDRIWYLAVAESGNSTYEDGKYLGAVLGCMNSQQQILFQKELHCPEKPEGLALDLQHGKFYVVTDADQRGQFSQLFEGDLPLL